MFRFEVIDHNGNRTRYNYQPGRYLIGKGDNCDVIINDSHVSRSHAWIVVEEHQVSVLDDNSTNGVWINGARIDESTVIHKDSLLQFGHWQLRPISLSLGAESASVDNSAPAATPPAQQATQKAPVPPPSVSAERPPTPPVAKQQTQVEAPMVNAEILDEHPSTYEMKLQTEEFIELKSRIQGLILDFLDLRKRSQIHGMSPEELRKEATEAAHEVIRRDIRKLPDGIDQNDLVKEVVAEAVGLGVLEPLLDDHQVTEIMVNGPNQVYIERAGRLVLTNCRFTSDRTLRAIIERIVAPLGRRIDESSPMVDARLPDGSRVNAIIPPLALNGPTITIRKFAKKKLFMEDLINNGSLSEDMAKFLKTAVDFNRNIIISGGTGSGKTTTLNILSNFIDPSERIVTIEDAAELQLNQDHVVSLESRPANAEGKGLITIRELVINALRMRPDRIVVGECRGGEALDMLQAMNTGHDGSMTSGHANSPRDFLARLEVMVMMAGIDLPSRAIREQVSSAVDIIIQQTRLADGTRRIVDIVEVHGIEGDVILLQPIFHFKRQGITADGKIRGEFVGTGYAPRFYDDARDAGIDLDRSIFGRDEDLDDIDMPDAQWG